MYATRYEATTESAVPFAVKNITGLSSLHSSLYLAAIQAYSHDVDWVSVVVDGSNLKIYLDETLYQTVAIVNTLESNIAVFYTGGYFLGILYISNNAGTRTLYYYLLDVTPGSHTLLLSATRSLGALGTLTEIMVHGILEGENSNEAIYSYKTSASTRGIYRVQLDYGHSTITAIQAASTTDYSIGEYLVFRQWHGTMSSTYHDLQMWCVWVVRTLTTITPKAFSIYFWMGTGGMTPTYTPTFYATAPFNVAASFTDPITTQPTSHMVDAGWNVTSGTDIPPSLFLTTNSYFHAYPSGGTWHSRNFNEVLNAYLLSNAYASGSLYYNSRMGYVINNVFYKILGGNPDIFAPEYNPNYALIRIFKPPSTATGMFGANEYLQILTTGDTLYYHQELETDVADCEVIYPLDGTPSCKITDTPTDWYGTQYAYIYAPGGTTLLYQGFVNVNQDDGITLRSPIEDDFKKQISGTFTGVFADIIEDVLATTANYIGFNSSFIPSISGSLTLTYSGTNLKEFLKWASRYVGGIYYFDADLFLHIVATPNDSGVTLEFGDGYLGDAKPKYKQYEVTSVIVNGKGISTTVNRGSGGQTLTEYYPAITDTTMLSTIANNILDKANFNVVLWKIGVSGLPLFQYGEYLLFSYSPEDQEQETFYITKVAFYPTRLDLTGAYCSQLLEIQSALIYDVSTTDQESISTAVANNREALLDTQNDISDVQTDISDIQTDISALQNGDFKTPYILVYSSTTISITDTSEHNVTYDTIEYSNGSGWTLSSEKVYVPTAGLYKVVCQIRFTSNSTGYRMARLWKNLIAQRLGGMKLTATNGAETQFTYDSLIYCSAGDYIKQTYRSSVTGITINIAAMGIYRVSK